MLFIQYVILHSNYSCVQVLSRLLSYYYYSRSAVAAASAATVSPHEAVPAAVAVVSPLMRLPRRPSNFMRMLGLLLPLLQSSRLWLPRRLSHRMRLFLLLRRRLTYFDCCCCCCCCCCFYCDFRDGRLIYTCWRLLLSFVEGKRYQRREESVDYHT